MKTTILIFIISLIIFSNTTSTQEFSVRSDFAGIQLFYTSLSKIFNKTVLFIARANKDSLLLSNSNVQYIEISGEGLSVKKKGTIYRLNSTEFPDIAYSLYYYFYSPKHPISEVVINLSDESRKITINGENVEQVEALRSLLQEQFDEFINHYSGSSFRIIAYLVLVGILFILTFPPILQKVFSLPNNIVTLIGLIPALFIISTFALPYDKWFSGFIVSNGETSFLRKYSGEISIFLSIISLIVYPIKYLIQSKKPANKK